MERGFGRAPPVTGRSLYLLGPGNGIRRAIHRFVHCKPFEVVVMACILANTVVMMLQDPSSLSSDVLDLNSTLATLDFIFLCVFTGEAILRIVALGFAIGPNTYLRDVWNRLDFIAVLSSWVTVLPGSIPRFTALRAPRGLKALRSVRFFTEIRAILRSLSFSVSLILNALTIMGFFFLMLSISSVEAFHRSMRRRCVYNGTLVSEPALSLPQRWCSRGELGGSSCPSYQECSGAVGNQYSHINFDNVLSAALALFEVRSTAHAARSPPLTHDPPLAASHVPGRLGPGHYEPADGRRVPLLRRVLGRGRRPPRLPHPQPLRRRSDHLVRARAGGPQQGLRLLRGLLRRLDQHRELCKEQVARRRQLCEARARRCVRADPPLAALPPESSPYRPPFPTPRPAALRWSGPLARC